MRRFGLAVVEGRSMSPTLRPGDRVLVAYGARPRRGRIAVVRLPGRPVSVKRLGVHAEGGWWVERDNPDEGVDSWSLGVPVADEDVLGIVLGRVRPWPPRRLH